MKSDVDSTFGIRTGPGAVLPADLVGVVVAAILVDVVLLVGAPGPVALAGAGLLLFFLPGYAIVAALYPGARPANAESDDDGRLLLAERIALSFATSVAAVAILGLVAWQVGNLLAGSATAGITREATLLLCTLLVAAGSVIAAVRRLRLPASDRFSVSASGLVAAGLEAAFGGDTRGDQLLSVALAASVLLAAGALGYALTSPVGAEEYTSATLLTAGEDGELVAANYPTELTAGESAALVLELGNHEGAATSYTAVVQLERVETGGGDATVTEARELDRLSVTVPAGETRTVPHEVAPTTTGERLRLSYYVYRGEAPANPSSASAYRHLYVWISVEGS